MNFKIVSYILGWVLRIEAVCMLVPCVIAFALGENTWTAFLIAITVAAVPGLFLGSKKLRTGNFFIREGYAATGLSWLVISLVGALPFFLSRRIPSFVDAFFEIISGFLSEEVFLIDHESPVSQRPDPRSFQTWKPSARDCFSGGAFRTGSAVWACSSCCLRSCR